MGDDSTRERTFQLEDTLPSLPVPDLERTLSKYLESVKVFATDEEAENTKALIEEFQNGVGKQLHEKLVEKAKKEKNWLEDWWENITYLRSREPMAVIGTMAGPGSINHSYWPLAEGTQLKRAAENMYGFTKYFLLMRREDMPIMRDRSKSAFSMWQYRSFFNTSRIPGETCDSLARYFKTAREGHCPSHIVVFCNGHIFKVDMVDRNGSQFGSYEIQRQLSYIKTQSEVKGQGIGILTADDRTSWAKTYAHLISLDPKNKENLEVIQSAMIAVSLDAERPGALGDAFRGSMCGSNPQDRWYDKSTSVIYFENGAIGYLADHCPYDGLIINLAESWVDDLIIKSKTDWLGTPNVQPDDIKPEEIVFTVDEKVEEAKLQAAETYRTQIQRVDACPSFFHVFGRNFPKEHSIHPDIFFQMAIQLSYYTKHGRPAPCYETATTRKYYHGRTATVRSTTKEAINWCKAMNNPDLSAKERRNFLQAAVGKQMMLGYDGLQAKGIDRHLLGLYLISLEMGIDTPAIFNDPMYTKSGGNGNFVLSTSLTGYERGFGGVVPMREDGYGIFYNLCKEEFYILVTSFKECEETDSLEFFQELTRSLIRMQEMILEAKQG